MNHGAFLTAIGLYAGFCLFKTMDSREQQADYQNKPSTDSTTVPDVAFDEQKAREGTKLLLKAIGQNPDEEGISETWDRRVPSMLKTLTEGMRSEAKPLMRTFDTDVDSLIVKTGVPVYSLCGHHMLPFYGIAHIAYRPGDEMVGLSKLIRYVRWQSRQLTTQEELTKDITTGLAEELDARGVLVELTATHMCEAMRGIETVTETTTREQVGVVTETDHKHFYEAIQRDATTKSSY